MIDMLAQVPVPEASAKAINYYHSGNVLWIFQWAWALGLPLLFLITGYSKKLGVFSKKCGKNWFFSLLVYLAVFIGLYQLLNLPIDFYANYIREHEYGLSTQTLGRWFSNYGKMTLVFFLSAAAFTWIFYLLLKKSPRKWWFYSSLVSAGIAFIMAFASPIWIAPLFNEMGPLKDKQLEKSILDLAARAGIEDGRVFEVDKSKDTTMGNAYVAGLGSTKRIVIWDTSIQSNSREGIHFIMGHEMGHYVLHHNWWLLICFSFFALVILYLTYIGANFLVSRYHKQLGFQQLSDIASLPLLLFLVNFFVLLSTPMGNYITRHFEREADRFGIEITRNNQVAAQLFADAVPEHLANPRPGIIYKVWRSTHPSLGDRVDFCNNCCPWETGQPLKYGKYFKEERMSKEDLSVQLCNTPQEKEAALQFRQRHFFDKISMKDPYVWTFNREGHKHFALYKEGRLIGYAHIQYWPDNRTALRIIVIDENERNHGYGAYLLKSCEQKLKEEGNKTLQTEAAPHVIEFYRKLGYSEMPFDDPDNHPSDKSDTPMGKRL